MAKIDWMKAQQDYVADPTMSYAKIAYKYGVSETVVKEWAARLEWTKQRELTMQKIVEKLPDKISDSIVAYQARKFHQGKLIADRAMGVLLDPSTKIGGKVANEMLANAHKLQTEALGIDKGTDVTINNNFISLTDFVAQMEKRQQVREPVIDGQEVQDTPGATS